MLNYVKKIILTIHGLIMIGQAKSNQEAHQ